MSRVPVAWRAWLPESALARCGVDQALADAARQWSSKWFARKTVRPLGTLAAALASPGDGAARWLALDDDVAIAISVKARDRLAMLMFGENDLPATISDADRPVIDSLVETALQDLCRRVAEILRLSPEGRWRERGEGEAPGIERPRGCLLGSDTATPLIQLFVATDLLIALARTRAARAPLRDRVKPIAAGLAAQTVAVSASLGHCSVTLADLTALAVGDVLLFDRRADAPLALAVDGKAAGRGRCTVQQGADSLELKLLEPLAFQDIL